MDIRGPTCVYSGMRERRTAPASRAALSMPATRVVTNVPVVACIGGARRGVRAICPSETCAIPAVLQGRRAFAFRSYNAWRSEAE